MSNAVTPPGASESNDRFAAEAVLVKLFWGSWTHDGYWLPNPRLQMSADEQYRQNVANGLLRERP